MCCSQSVNAFVVTLCTFEHAHSFCCPLFLCLISHPCTSRRKQQFSPSVRLLEFTSESTQRAQVVGTCAWQRVGQPNCCRIIAVLLNLLSGARTFVPSRVRRDPKRCDRVTIPVRDRKRPECLEKCHSHFPATSYERTSGPSAKRRRHVVANIPESNVKLPVWEKSQDIS